jgi:DNA-binding beta-propeller fold protein YncE
MTRLSKIVTIAMLFPLFVLCLPLPSQSRVDWQETSVIKLPDTPIDVARSQDGDYTFILTGKGSVAIYSADGKQIGEIPVDSSVSNIAISPKGDQLYLINSEHNTLKTINIGFIADINIGGSPFQGPAGAQVAVVVFSDFQ